MVPLVVWIIRLDSPRYFFALVAAVAAMAVVELYAMAEGCGIHPHRWWGAAGTVLVTSTFLPDGPNLGLVLSLCAAAVPLISLLGRQAPSEALSSMATTLFGVLLVGLLLGHAVALRCVEGHGVQLVFFLLWVIWSADTVAYGVGTLLGRRAITPRISPNKTVEGTVAGLAVALGAAFVGRLWFLPELPWWHAIILGGILGTLAFLGDLCESLLKRGAQVKDSAGWLPGHGGFLDRTDSFLLSAPLLYHYWNWLRP